MPPLSLNYPWSQNLEAEEGDTQANIFYNLHDPMSHYRCEFPVLLGKRIRGCFHGCWTLLSSNHPHDVMWSLWNPMTSKMINLPPMIHKGSKEGIRFCCLSAPPDHPNSVLLLTRTKKLNIVFCRLGSERKKLRWTEMTYAKQVRSITGFNGPLLNLTCCNGKVYANIRVDNNITRRGDLTVEVNIVVNDRKRKKLREVVITLLPVTLFPFPTIIEFCKHRLILKGSCTQLFTIAIRFEGDMFETVGGVNLFKLDMNNRAWEEMEDLKDTILYVDLCSEPSFICSPAIASSELGGYIHFLSVSRKTIYSYHVKDKTMSLSSMPCLVGTSHVSAWHSPMPECTRLQGDHAHSKQSEDKGDHAHSKQGEDKGDHAHSKQEDKGDEIVVRSVNGDHEVEFNSMKDESHLLNFPLLVLKMIKEVCVCVECLNLLPVSCYGYRLESYHADFKEEEEDNDDIIVRSVMGESPLLNIPLHVLEMVMEYSVGVEYLKFRFTCKRCHLAAPLIHGIALKRLQTYSLLSPCWLMVFDKHKGIITFTDPLFGDKYYMKTPQELICDFWIMCSRYGWLLIQKHDGSLVFFNPFTCDIRKLPLLPSSNMICFSAPPTCPDCMVAGLTEGYIFIHFLASEPPFGLRIALGSYSYCFLTFYGQDLYATRADGGLDVFKEIGRENYSLKRDFAKALTSCCTYFTHPFQVRCDQHLFQVIVGSLGKSVEVFKLNVSTKEWVKIDSLGKHMIFIFGTNICIDAKTPQMENKIFFPMFPSNNGKNILFYSLETCRYHTFNNKNIQDSFGDFLGMKYYLTPESWIEPSWS